MYLLSLNEVIAKGVVLQPVVEARGLWKVVNRHPPGFERVLPKSLRHRLGDGSSSVFAERLLESSRTESYIPDFVYASQKVFFFRAELPNGEYE